MRRGAAIAGALAIVAGCADDAVDPITRITRPRVIAVTTEPSALALDGALELIAWTVDPGGPRIGIGAGDRKSVV